MMWRLVWRLKARGSRISFMLASSGVRFPLLRFQPWQQATSFSHVEVRADVFSRQGDDITALGQFHVFL